MKLGFISVDSALNFDTSNHLKYQRYFDVSTIIPEKDLKLPDLLIKMGYKTVIWERQRVIKKEVKEMEKTENI